MQHKHILLTAILVLTFLGRVHAQGTAVNPEIGKPVPAFVLYNIGNYKKPTMSSADFRGRHVIIDFWNKNCVSCVQSFPKLNKLHHQYNSRLDLVLVGAEEKGIQEMFATFRDRQNLEFAYAFNMPMYKSFVPGGAPHVVWIDDRGVVKAVTGGTDLNEKNIEAFLQNKPFNFRDNSHAFIAKQEAEYSASKPFLVAGNGSAMYDTTFRYRSLISEYIPGTPLRSWPDINLWNQKYSTGRPDGKDGKRRIFETCAGLREIYTVAYTGHLQWGYGDKLYNDIYGGIILEMADTSNFEADIRNGGGLFWYSLIMPAERVTPEYVMDNMQTDLKRYFGYTARMETRTFPTLKIVATDKVKKLLTKHAGEKPDGKADHSMFKVTNIPLNDFFRFALGYHANYWENPTVPIMINDTGFTQNVDIDVKMNDSDWNDVQRVLGELGFKLVPGEKEMKVLVISDK